MFKTRRHLLFQTGGPPRRIVPITENPLTKWSEDLSWPSEGSLNCTVGLEGCLHAFNYTNAIRTALFFRCARPPTFLAAKSVGDIHSLQLRERSGREKGAAAVSLFGRDKFEQEDSLLVTLENFDPRCVQVTQFKFPCDWSHRPWRLVIGHENNGVSQHLLRKADHVVYVPQFGTISSLNVVSTLGIALHYASCFWEKKPSLPHGAGSFGGVRQVAEDVGRYQQLFQAPVPQTVDAGNGSGRVDMRPIHPKFYAKTTSEICSEHKQLRLLMFPDTAGCSGISVLYENQVDQRNFGGLMRNANAFACDSVLYWGRRKLNVVGAVGSNHYLKPIYLGPSEDTAVHAIDDIMAAPSPFVEGLVWAFVSCGHEGLLQESEAAIETYLSLLRDDSRQLLLSEESSCGWQHAAVSRKVLLVVPQEGRLPPAAVMSRCSLVIHLDRSSLDEARRYCTSKVERAGTAASSNRVGLPSQVATAICLHRLLLHRFPHLH